MVPAVLQQKVRHHARILAFQPCSHSLLPPLVNCFNSLGRKFWLVEASFQMMAAEIAMTAVIATQMTPEGSLPAGATIGLLIVVCFFIAGHAWGWGPMVGGVVASGCPWQGL
jgi:hypothetical protein